MLDGGLAVQQGPSGPPGEQGYDDEVALKGDQGVKGSVGDPVVSALSGKVEHGGYGLVVTLGTFTSQAKAFAKSKSNLRLIDGDDLVKLIFEHYEHFDAEYKRLLPLRRVYVPEPIEDAEE